MTSPLQQEIDKILALENEKIQEEIDRITHNLTVGFPIATLAKMLSHYDSYEKSVKTNYVKSHASIFENVRKYWIPLGVEEITMVNGFDRFELVFYKTKNVL